MATVRPVGLRGMLRPQPENIHLRFSDYLVHTELPALPKGGYGHLANEPQGFWGWYGNNMCGDCVAAGAMHETMVFAKATHRPIPTFNRTWEDNYSEMLVAGGGQPYDPHDRSTDTGLDPQVAAGYRRTQGIVDDNGDVHKIDAYALIEDIDQLKLCIYLFGVAGWGGALPATAEQQFGRGYIWDDLRSQPNPHNGHYTPICAFNSAGHFVHSTWDSLQASLPDYVERYWSIGVAYLSQEYMLASGKSPEQYDWASLEDDLQSIIAT